MPYTANDAFCAIADVETLVLRGPFSAGTTPTSQQVLDMMARVAGEVETLLHQHGSPYTVASHGNPFPSSVTDPSSTLRVLCEQANAMGAAADVVNARESGQPNGSTDLAAVMLTRYKDALAAIESECRSTAASSSAVTPEPAAEGDFYWTDSTEW